MDPKSVQSELFDKFNAEGSRVTVRGAEFEKPLDLGLVDSWRVVRAAAHAGGDGMDFWVLWRTAGFLDDLTPEKSHLVKVLTWDKTLDDLRLHDEQGREYIVDFLDRGDQRAWLHTQASKRHFPTAWRDVDQRQVKHFEQLANGVAA